MPPIMSVGAGIEDDEQPTVLAVADLSKARGVVH